MVLVMMVACTTPSYTAIYYVIFIVPGGTASGPVQKRVTAEHQQRHPKIKKRERSILKK